MMFVYDEIYEQEHSLTLSFLLCKFFSARLVTTFLEIRDQWPTIPGPQSLVGQCDQEMRCGSL